MQIIKTLFIFVSISCYVYPASWQHCPAFTDHDIKAIRFIKPAIGLVVTTDEAWLTTDSGYSWLNLRAPIDSGSYFTSWFIHDVKHVWLESFNWTKRKSVFFSTTDGGNKWEKDTMIGGQTKNGLFFSDSINGWRCSSSLTKTVDGGKNWIQSFKSPIENGLFQTICFLDSLIGFLTGTEDSDFRNLSPETVIYKTIDGGMKWEMVCKPDPIGNKPIPVLANIGTVNSTTILFLGTEQFQYDLIIQMPTIIASFDQGVTWNIHELFPIEIYDPKYYVDCFDFSFLSTSVGYVVAARSYTDSGIVMATADSGKTWKQEFEASEKLNAIQILSSDYGWCGGESGALYILTNRKVASRLPSSRHVIGTLRNTSATHYLLNGQKSNCNKIKWLAQAKKGKLIINTKW